METQISQTNLEVFASASKVIWDTLAEGPKVDMDSYCLMHDCCSISATESCGLASFKTDEPTLVYPGGSTSCIFSTSTEYSFNVIKGDADKLLIHFQGGGACWNEMSTNLNFCTTDAVPDSNGVFDKSDIRNPYKDFTIVEILYCSGDLHAGNVVRDYTDSAGQPVVQVGQINTQSVLDWIKTQQSNGGLAPTLSQLTLNGCSAGSIGVQVWSDVLLSTLSYHHAAVVPDSYAGVFPEGSQGPLIYDYGMCSWLTDPDLVESCNKQTITLQDITETYMKKNSDIAYGFIQSKSDWCQIAFYSAVAASCYPNATILLTPEEFYSDVNIIFDRYNPNANFVSYLITDYQHCYTPLDVFYSADSTGKSGKGTFEPMLMDWMPQTGEIDTECDGEALGEGDWSGTKYCDAGLVGKAFEQI